MPGRIASEQLISDTLSRKKTIKNASPEGHNIAKPNLYRTGLLNSDSWSLTTSLFTNLYKSADIQQEKQLFRIEVNELNIQKQ